MQRESNNSGNCNLLNHHQSQDQPQPGVVPEINAVGLTTRKRRGEAAEAVFLAKASGLGFGVSKPWGDSERYDFILDSGRSVWRVEAFLRRLYSTWSNVR